MNLKRWSSVFLMMGLILVLSPLGAQADPYRHGHDYGWNGPRPHEFKRYRKHFRRGCGGPHHSRTYVQEIYTAPPSVAYLAPVAPMIGIPQQQPYYGPSVPNGLHGNVTFGY